MGVFVDALPELTPLLVFALLLAICLSVKAFVQAIVTMIRALTSGIPWIGGVIAGVLTEGEQAVSNVLGNWIATLEAHIATEWHSFAHLLSEAWAEQVRVAENLWHIVQNIPPVALVRGEINAIRHAISAISHWQKTITRDVHHVTSQVTTVVESLPRSIARRLTAAEHAIDVTIPKEIKSARALAREAEDGVARLWDALRSLPTEANITAAVATAIAALGLGAFDWLKCASRNSLLGVAGCDLWNLLEDALGLLIDGLIFADLCELIPLVEDAYAPFASDITGLISDAANAVCATPAGWVPSLPVPALDLPTQGELTATV